MSESVLTIPLPGLPLGATSVETGARQRPVALPGFVVGAENRTVEVVVQAILAEHAPDAPLGYNPLYVYGPTGTGKSHLLRGLVAAWKNLGRGPTLYVAAEDFARQLTDAYETHAIEELRGKYRRAGLVAVDDVGRLAGKGTAQAELAALLDEAAVAGNRVLLSGASAPQQLTECAARLVSRLTAGMGLALVWPERAARRELLAQLAALREMDLADGLLDLLADELSGGARELAAALLQLDTRAKLLGRPLGLEQVQRYLGERVQPRLPEVKQIALSAARHFGLRLAELRSPSRRQAVVTARGVAMYLARQLTHDSLEQIGRYFGGRDHTTVLHACRKTEELVGRDPAVLLALRKVQEELQTS